MLSFLINTVRISVSLLISYSEIQICKENLHSKGCLKNKRVKFFFITFTVYNIHYITPQQERRTKIHGDIIRLWKINIIRFNKIYNIHMKKC